MSQYERPTSGSSVKITARTTGQEWIVRAGEQVDIRRDPNARIPLLHEKVSRSSHATLAFVDGYWWLIGERSANGIHVNGQRQEHIRLDGRTIVRFGTAQEGEDLAFDLVAAPEVGLGPAPSAPPLGSPNRPLPSDRPPVPLDPVASNAMDPRDARTTPAAVGGAPGPTLQISLSGGPARFFPPTRPVTIGRAQDADFQVDHPGVSRRHVTATPGRQGWFVVDESTHQSTWLDGLPFRSGSLDRVFELVLGDRTSGPRLQLNPGLAAPVVGRRPARGWLIGAIAAAVVLIVVAAFAVFSLVRAPQADSSAALLTAKRATVRLEMADTQGRLLGHGSGVVIDGSGLILTNAHVASPKATGQGYLYSSVAVTEPEIGKLLVGIVGEQDDQPVEYSYLAETVSVDGYLDLATVKIVSTADGSPLPEGFALPAMPMGDSRKLATGQTLTVLGFPGISKSEALTVTTGVVSTFSPDQRLKSTRGWIDTDARTAPGNSGGPVVDADFRLVGIHALSSSGRGTSVVSGQFRPIEVAGDVIGRGKAGTATDTGANHLPNVSAVQATPLGLLGKDSDCTKPTGITAARAGEQYEIALFSAQGVPADAALFLSVKNAKGQYLEFEEVQYQVWAPSERNKSCANFRVPIGVAGKYIAELWTDPVRQAPLASLQFDVTAEGRSPTGGGSDTTDSPAAGECAADVASPSTWYTAQNGAGLDLAGVKNSNNEDVLPAGRARFIQTVGDAAGYADQQSADQQVLAAVQPVESTGQFPDFQSQRWLVVGHAGRYFAVHAQHIPAVVPDPQDATKFVQVPQPCVLSAQTATVVAWHGLARGNGTEKYRYDYANSQGTWTKLG